MHDAPVCHVCVCVNGPCLLWPHGFVHMVRSHVTATDGRESRDDRHSAESATHGLDMGVMLERRGGESTDDRHAAQSANQGLDMSVMLEKDGESDQDDEPATPLRKDHVGNVLAHAVASNTEAAKGVTKRAEKQDPEQAPAVKNFVVPATLQEQEVHA